MFIDEDQGKGDGRDNQKAPPDCLLEEEIISEGGQDIVIRSEAYVQKPDGSLVRQKKVHYEMAADGRWLSPGKFVALSWTRMRIPDDRHAECMNPFMIHEQQRNVYLGIDGFLTRLGNVLCSECMELNDKRQMLKKWMVFGLLFNPEEF